jgi:NodT family efflux transporter outer membrane factor (OMF) lipoprotein
MKSNLYLINKFTSVKPLRKWFGMLTVICAVLATAGCMSVGPDYVKPDTKAPDRWHSTLKNGLVSGSDSPQAITAWWSELKDPALTGLINRAVENNLDVKEARARIREARARRNIRQAGQYPSITAEGSAIKSRTSGTSGVSTESDLYSMGFDAGWELDLFGGLRRTLESAEADMDASRESLHQTLVSLLAEVALNYTEVRTFQTRIDVAKANLRSQEETYQIVDSKYQAGLSNELSVQQALYNLSSTQSQIPALETGLEQARNRLSVLSGMMPGQLHKELEAHGKIPVTPVTLAIGIPADALRQRPDVRRAERLLAAQTARIGTAKADLYPKIRLGGSIGLESLSAGDLFSDATRIWHLGPSISWPVFDAGAIRDNINVQTELQNQALYQYESAVMTALEEVENNLTAYVNEQIRRQALIEAEQAARKAVMLAEYQYKAGLVDFSIVLEAQRSESSFQDSLAQSEGTVIINLIRLYKSMGGGWTSFTSENTSHSE